MNAELLRLARQIALQAGKLAAQRKREGVSIAATKSSDVDVVTAADRETEALIRSLIAEARPDDAFLGEESDAAGGSSGLVWIVDPIDGTVNYLYGSPSWAVSIAVGRLAPDAPDASGASDAPESAEPTESWTALAGVVYAPIMGELYSASEGGGAWLELLDASGAAAHDATGAAGAAVTSAGTGEMALAEPRRLRVNAAVPLAQALIATGFSYSAERRAAQAEVLRELLPLVRDLRRSGSAALDLCAVASGRVNAFFERHINPWDHAAAALIAREAGAQVGGFAGRGESADLVAAAEPALFDPLLAVLTDARGPKITTERLVLRRWRESDREPFAAMNADERVMEHFPALLDAAASDAMIDRIEAGFERNGYGLWAVERRDTGDFIGFVGLAKPRFTAHFTSPARPAIEIGWRLAADAWGNGFASEAARAVLAWGFEALDLDEIVSFTARSNFRSQHVMQRIGMLRDESEDFAHPALDADHRLSMHVLYRAKSPARRRTDQ